jgi:hypothetical protein
VKGEGEGYGDQGIWLQTRGHDSTSEAANFLMESRVRARDRVWVMGKGKG